MTSKTLHKVAIHWIHVNVRSVCWCLHLMGCTEEGLISDVCSNLNWENIPSPTDWWLHSDSDQTQIKAKVNHNVKYRMFLKQRIRRTYFEAFCNLVSSWMWQRSSKSHSRVHALLIFPPNVDHSQQMLQDWWIVKYLHSAESRGWLVWCLHFFYLMAFLEHHVFFSEILIIILEY